MAANGSDGPKPGLSIRLFGPGDVRLNGAPLLSLRSRKGHWLLALLTLRHGQTVERNWLAGTLWPESTEATGLHNLRNSLTALRRALGPEAARLQAPTPHTLCLDLAGAEADVLAFDAAVRQGDQSSLRSAVALYHGPLLEGCAEEWLFAERQIRQEAFLQALETLARHALAGRELRVAESYLRRAVTADPLREGAQRQLMQVLAASGNYAAVLQLYRELRLRLHHDLNAEADPETTSLFQQLRTEARERAGVRGPGSGASRGVASRQSDGTTPAGYLAPSLTPDPWPLAPDLPLSLARGRLVGRDAELAALKRQVNAAWEGAGATLFLAGEPGIGKTRLATEVSVHARLRGFRVLAGRCDKQGAAPYQPLVEALREYLDTAEAWQVEQAMPPPIACELVRIVPQIAGKVKEIPQVPPLPAEPARQALTDAVRQFFAFVTTQEAPILLFLDDLHWADEGTLALLHALARQAKKLRLLILGTYRDVELEAQHPLERTLSALNRERLSQRVLLRRLCEPAVAQMVAALLDEPLPTPFLALLHRQTEGNPFFIEEMLQHLMEEGAIYREDGRWQIQLPEQIGVPQSIKVTIERRLQRLGEESREALALAAVIGQQFSFDLLLQASGLEEERLLAITEEWLGAHLVVEQRVGRQELYRFQHALIRAVPYEALSRRRRARLHERVGLALEAAHPRALEEHLEELAHHFAQARSGTAVEKGTGYCLRAGEKARTLYANAEAIQHLTAALELLEGLPEDEPHLRRRWEVVDNLAKAYSACRAFERAQEVLRDCMDFAQRASYRWGMAAAQHGMYLVLRQSQGAAGAIAAEHSRRCRWEHLERSIRIADEQRPGTREAGVDWRSRARLDLARLLSTYGDDLPRSEALLRETLQAPEAFSREDIQEAHALLMQVCALQGKWDAVTAALRQSVPFGGPSGLAFCLGTMEDALTRAGKQAAFIAFCEEAKALCAQAGLPLPLNQWYLQPTAPSEELPQLLFRDDFDASELRPEWEWRDLAQVSAYNLSERLGHLTLRAGQAVDLCPPYNLNAPRMLLEVRGDFALEMKMVGDWDERDEDETSGLLVWKDVLNYVRLDKFVPGHTYHANVRLEARVAGAHEIFGRGQLRGDTYYFRLERTGDRFAALCCTDGALWLTCGQVALPVNDPLWVGVWAGDAMVAHFDYVQVLGRGDCPPR